jgi:hypothetical protein
MFCLVFFKAPQTISCAKSNRLSIVPIDISESSIFMQARRRFENGRAGTCALQNSPSRFRLWTLPRKWFRPCSINFKRLFRLLPQLPVFSPPEVNGWDGGSTVFYLWLCSLYNGVSPSTKYSPLKSFRCHRLSRCLTEWILNSAVIVSTRSMKIFYFSSLFFLPLDFYWPHVSTNSNNVTTSKCRISWHMHGHHEIHDSNKRE